MDKVRMWQTIGLWLRFSSRKRANYLRDHHIFKSVGEHCIYMPRKVPLYPNLIKLGDYVDVSSNVTFATHDGIHTILGPNNDVVPEVLKKYKFTESIGCIDIGSHVFIGAGCSIGANVKIGDNVVITAGSVVTNDIPSNSVVRGNPAKVICSLSQFLTMKAAKKGYPTELDHKMGVYVSKELEDWLWSDFYQSREK